MSTIQVLVNGTPLQLTQSLLESLVILSTGLDQNAISTLNNVLAQNLSPDGGNIKIGDGAFSNTVNTPQTNIAIGCSALPQANASVDNISIGTESLYNVTLGSKNIGIGSHALGGLSTQTNTIGIGNYTQASASNGIIIGNNANLINNNSGMLKFNSITTNTTYPASNEFWFGDSSTGWIDTRAGKVYAQDLNVAGTLTTSALSLSKLQVTSDTGYIDLELRPSTYSNTLNKIDEIQNTASFRNKYGPIAFIADVSGQLSSITDPFLREKILFGYQQGTKAIEINSYGAISLDSYNSGNPLPALVSNYGTNGQVIMSQGSSSNAKWSTLNDISGVITTYGRNIGGITYVRDISGNLDSSSNFIFDGSGITLIGTKTSSYPMLRLINNGTGIGTKTQFTLSNSTTSGITELKSATYQQTTNSIDESINNLSLKNSQGDISLIPGSTKKILLGYTGGTKAYEINSLGALSFDTSGNNDIPLTFTSNYGNSSQVVISQGSNAPPRWVNVYDLSGVTTTFGRNINGITYVRDLSGNIDSTSNFIYDGSGITSIGIKSGTYPMLRLINNGIGVGTKTQFTLSNPTTSGVTELKSSTYQQTSNSVDETINNLSLKNSQGDITFIPGSTKKILFGYNSGAKAFEINSSGALSFDTSGNNDTNLTLTSNYGMAGQVISSQGSTTNPRWTTITDISGVITTYGRNIGGITYVRDVSGNLDTSSNFIYDGSGINIVNSKNSNLWGLQIQNSNSGTSASTDVRLINDVNTYGRITLRGSNYNSGTQLIDNFPNMYQIQNTNGKMVLLASDSILFGYSGLQKAIEINSSGAMSFDTSNNSGTLISNYGTSGQVLISQGSSAPPKWSSTGGGGGIIIVNPVVTGIPYVIDGSGNMDSSSKLTWDGSGINITKNVTDKLYGLQIQNGSNNTVATTDILLKNDTQSSTIELKSSTYTGTPNIDDKANMLSIKNTGPITINSSDRTLIAHTSNTKAVEINSSGAISFNTTNIPSGTYNSNYGTTGQVLISKGSSSAPQWTTLPSSGITVANPNLNGITYVIDGSGNLDSSSNFIYDGSGIQITSTKNSTLTGLQIQNSSSGSLATTDFTLKNTATNTASLELKSSGYTDGTSIDAKSNMLSITNLTGSININSPNKTLIGYSSNTKAIEIASTGAMSFDTSNNSGTWVSNYGTTGQVLTSKGSSSNPQWTTLPSNITVANPNVNGITYVIDSSGNLDSNSNFIWDGSGLNILTTTSGPKALVTVKNTKANGQTQIQMQNSQVGNTSVINFNGSGYINATNKINQGPNALSIENTNGVIALIPDSSNTTPSTYQKILLGYQSGYKAIEINNNGAISFDTSGNNDSLQTFTSNYGNPGQVIISQGSSSNIKWSNVTDISGIITTFGRNIGGITFVKDASGNLDSSSNFIYDGSGIQITSTKNSTLTGLQIQNSSSGSLATTDFTLKNTATNTASLELKSSGYTDGTSIDAKSNMLSITNLTGSININSPNKTLIGYSSNTKAIEIASTGAMSFDTSNNSGTWVSNYGNPGQLLTSNGSSSNPSWSNPVNTTAGNVLFSSTGTDISGLSVLNYTSGNNTLNLNAAILGGTPNFTPAYGTPMLITHNDTVSNQMIFHGIVNTATEKTKLLLIDSSGNDTTKYFGLELNSSIYQQASNLVTEGQLYGNIVNKQAPIVLASNGGVLFGYKLNQKAIKINNNGAISFDTSGNGDYPLTTTSNYGNPGQVMISQGSASNVKWSNVTDISGVITTYNKNVNGITYVKDASGNLDSSSNFIYDGSGLLIINATEAIGANYPKSQIVIDGSANTNIWGLEFRNSNSGTAASTNMRFYNDTANFARITYCSSTYGTAGSTIFTVYPNLFGFINTGPILLNSSSGLLFGYSSAAKAIEINSSGAMSFDTTHNSGTLTSNYGTSGQVMTSQGSSSAPSWTTLPVSISVQNPNINGIAYIRDGSGNLDSSSNFIYDGSGIQITSTKNSSLLGLQIQNTNTGTNATTDLNIKTYSNTATLKLSSTNYTPGTTIDAQGNILSLTNTVGSINLNSNSKTLIGYSSNTRALEIASTGAVSFDTSNNSGTWVSNYGTSGQILSSQGSSLPPKWITNTGGISVQNPNINGIAYIRDGSGNLDSSSNFIYDGSGIQITSTKNSSLLGLQIQNTNTGTNATTDLNIKTYSNTATLKLSSTNYTPGTTIDAQGNILSLTNTGGSINLNSNSKTFIGYSSNTRAIEIASSGAVSFDTQYASGSWVSNYGTSGQVMTSQGSSSAPKWTSLVNVPSTSLLYSTTGTDISGSNQLEYYGNTLSTTNIEANRLNLNFNKNWILNTASTGSTSGYLAGAIDNNKLLVASPNNGIYSSVAPYTSWTTEISNGTYWCGCAISGSNMIACGFFGDVWANLGSGWVKQSGTAPFSSYQAYFIVGISGTNMIACNAYGSVFANITGSWVEQTSIPTSGTWSYVAISGTNMIAAQQGVQIFYNLTGTWVSAGLPAYNWRSVGISGTNMIAASDNGGVWTNFGSGWVQETLSISSTWVGVSISNKYMLANASNGSVWLNFGNGWIDQTAYGITSGYLYGGCGLSNKSAIVVTSDTKQIYTLINTIQSDGEITASTLSGLAYIDVSGVGKGSSGQVLTSGGSSTDISWNYIPKILYANTVQYGSDTSGTPLTLISPSAFTGLISGRTRVVTFTTGITIITNATVLYTLYVNSSSTSSYTMQSPGANIPVQHTMIFNYSSATTSDTIYITATASGNVSITTNDCYSLRFEQL